MTTTEQRVLSPKTGSVVYGSPARDGEMWRLHASAECARRDGGQPDEWPASTADALLPLMNEYGDKALRPSLCWTCLALSPRDA